MSVRIINYKSLESTNITAKELAVSGAEHGTVVIADCQTAGKGRHGRSFYSPPDCGIYMSVILRPTGILWRECPTLVTAYTAVSVCGALETGAGLKPQIKWVNDIFLGGRKICGISTETSTDSQSGDIRWIIVGIGVNFTEPPSGFPEELRDIAGSVFVNEPPITKDRLAAEIANRVAALDNVSGGEVILSEYRRRLMILNRRVTVSGMGEPFEATALDIDGQGRLIVRKECGGEMMLCAGEVSLSRITV
jgi:BirA family biotin operon repressor/biotin-[acetyl-CoA-carboxylase] ligase